MFIIFHLTPFFLFYRKIASYQLSIENLIQENSFTADEARNLIKKSVEIARSAINESGNLNILIAGSVGPYGATKCDGSEFNGSYAENISLEVKNFSFIIKL